jgi:SAM-dependent methyltransferase
VHEILKHLPPGSFVLDLGCAEGSFEANATQATVIRIDRELPHRTTAGAWFVQADAATLPFANRSIAAVISNNSLEHFEKLEHALAEIARVLQPCGALFVSVPDASTLTDKLYRWLARGGGHVNAFVSPTDTVLRIERGTGLPHVATRVLCSSLSFLNRRNAVSRTPRKLLLLGGGSEWSLFLYGWVSRRIDCWFGMRSSVYGWAFYFGNVTESIDTAARVNVCIRCGSGSSSARLRQEGMVKRGMAGVSVYRCPTCGAAGPFAEDFGVE